MSMHAKCQSLNWPASRFGGPRIIGHRGASHHALENTLAAFQLASELGADMWELDVRLTKDGVCVVSHDDDLERVFGVQKKLSSMTADELAAMEDVAIPTLAEVIALANQLDTGLYVEIKGEGAGMAALNELKDANFAYAALGSFIAEWVAELGDSDCPYPLAVLVRVGEDPFERAKIAKSDAIHLCWERASDNPHELLTPELLHRAKDEGQEIVLWHEERPHVISAVMAMNVQGVCSDRPELMVPYAKSPSRPSLFPKGPEVCCHRGVNKLAPENTMSAGLLTFDQDFDWLEIDVHETVDGELAVIHDNTLDRTTNGRGMVANYRLSELRNLDAGGWFSDRFKGEKIPTLQEVITLAQDHGKGLYIEIKQGDPQKILQVVKDMDFLDHCFFWSFDWSCIVELRALCPEAHLMARSLDFHTVTDAVNSVQAEIIEINMSEDFEPLVAAAKATDARIMLCYMGTDIAIFERMIELEPQMVNVNHSHIWKEVWFNHCQKQQEKIACQ